MQENLRVLNVIVAGHAQHGKSSLIEAIVGKFPDNLDFELSHGTTVSLKVIQFYLKRQKLNLNFLDTPGHADFKTGIALGLEFADLLVLVISGSEGFQARTYWLLDKAIQKKIPIIVAATKMDLRTASIDKIKNELDRLEHNKIPIIKTSAKNSTGIEDLIGKISIYIKIREDLKENLKFLILGYEFRKGIGDVINIGILSGTIETGWISDKIKIRHLFSLKGVLIKTAFEGDIVQVALNVSPKFDLGTIYNDGKFFTPKMGTYLSEIQPRKEFFITIDDPAKFKIAIDVLEEIKKIFPNFDYYIDKTLITLLVLGDLQFEFLKEKLEDLMEFKIVGSQIKGIITINKTSKGRYRSAQVRIVPRVKKNLTILREGKDVTELFDIIGASAAYDAFHLDGLHVTIYSGKNEDDIAQAIANAIGKVKIIKIHPQQEVILKVENYFDIFSLIERYNIEILHQTQANAFFLQVKNEFFEDFFNSLMKISKGQADINLFKFDQEEKILSVDPGTRHYGFCLLERGELPSLWYINLKNNIQDARSHKISKKQLEKELNIFLGKEKELINKIYIGNGPGSEFIIDYLIEYFNIQCENYECVISDFDPKQNKDEVNDQSPIQFNNPEIYLVDEFKTTKEALFHLQQGKLINEVQSKGFVDHAIAALLIAKKGLKGEIINIKQKPMKILQDYIIENYAGSYSFGTIHNVRTIYDITPGMHLRVKDSSLLDSNLSNGDIITFTGFGEGYNSIHASNLLGNRIIVKFQGNVKLKRDFFKILVPVKERT